MRVGLDARLTVWRLAFLVGAGYLGVLDAGEVYDRFSAASVGGIDTELTLAVILGSGFETRLGAHYERYFSTFEPEVGDAYVAGGALDQVVGVRLGAAYVF